MTTDASSITSGMETDQDSLSVAQVADQSLETVIIKGNHPERAPSDEDQRLLIDMSDDEKIDVVAARILKKYRRAFEELAK